MRSVTTSIIYLSLPEKLPLSKFRLPFTWRVGRWSKIILPMHITLKAGVHLKKNSSKKIPLITFTGFLLPISHISLAQDKAVLSANHKIKLKSILKPEEVSIIVTVACMNMLKHALIGCRTWHNLSSNIWSLADGRKLSNSKCLKSVDVWGKECGLTKGWKLSLCPSGIILKDYHMKVLLRPIFYGYTRSCKTTFRKVLHIYILTQIRVNNFSEEVFNVQSFCHFECWTFSTKVCTTIC